MSDKYFVDTNVLMYAHDKAAGAKHERAKTLVEELWRGRTGVGLGVDRFGHAAFGGDLRR